MPANTDTVSTLSRQEFCVALKRARESKGITLAAVAERTKIAAELFATLERNDLRRWPKGIFRRSFFRDYVVMIGVPVAEACAEFARLFPEDDGEELNKRESGKVIEPAAGKGEGHASVLSRISTAVIDAFSNAFRSAIDLNPGQPDDPEVRGWVTDARRVGPAPPRVRVRIKVQK